MGPAFRLIIKVKSPTSRKRREKWGTHHLQTIDFHLTFRRKWVYWFDAVRHGEEEPKL